MCEAPLIIGSSITCVRGLINIWRGRANVPSSKTCLNSASETPSIDLLARKKEYHVIQITHLCKISNDWGQSSSSRPSLDNPYVQPISSAEGRIELRLHVGNKGVRYLDHVFHVVYDLPPSGLCTTGSDVLRRVRIDATDKGSVWGTIDARGRMHNIGAWWWNVETWIFNGRKCPDRDREHLPITMVGLAGSKSACAASEEGSGMTFIPPNLTFTLHSSLFQNVWNWRDK